MENKDQPKAKILPFRDPNYSIFSPSLRKRIEADVVPFTEKPEEVVSVVECAISNWIVAKFRQWATNLGQKAGEKIGRSIAGAK